MAGCDEGLKKTYIKIKDCAKRDSGKRKNHLNYEIGLANSVFKPIHILFLKCAATHFLSNQFQIMSA